MNYLDKIQSNALLCIIICGLSFNVLELKWPLDRNKKRAIFKM